ncbi:hypothetical protein [Gemella cuniculi]|uniref:hypothetical protein n=1 Tax=Gemella cuniculi TaxID=150240 RepID=UPI00041BB737|nr:hypothetical protein [Gemella cuniculi]
MIKRVEEITEELIEINGRPKKFYSLTTCVNKYIQEELAEDELLLDIKYISESVRKEPTKAILHIGEKH